MLFSDSPGAERGAEQNVEEKSCVLLGLDREMVPTLDYHQLAAELLNIW